MYALLLIYLCQSNYRPPAGEPRRVVEKASFLPEGSKGDHFLCVFFLAFFFCKLSIHVLTFRKFLDKFFLQYSFKRAL